MAVLRSLVTTLGMNSAQYRADLKKAKTSTSDFSVQVKKIAKTSATAFAAVATAAADAATVLVRESMASNDVLAKFSDRIGIATEALAGLQHAGELTGVSSDRMNDSLQGMVERVSEATEGTGEAAEALANLGLNAQALNQLSPDQQFLKIAEAMGEVENRSDQVRMAIQLFEGEGAALLNTLDMGADGIQAMMQEAIDLGAAMNRVDAAKIEAANDAMYRAGLGSTALGNTLSTALSPYIVVIADQFTKASLASNGFKDEVTTGMEFVAQAIGYTSNVVHGLNVVWEIVEQGVREFVGTAVYNLAELDKAVTDLLNKLPGVQAETSQSLQLMADVMVDDIQRGRDELSALLNEPLPHQAVQDWFANVRTEADKAAQAVAASKQGMSVITGGGGGDVTATGGDDLASTEDGLEQIRQQYASEQQLLLDKTLLEQETLIAAEQAKLLSEQESQALRKASWDNYYLNVNKEAEASAQKQAQAQAQANNQILQMQMSLAGNALGIIKSSAEEGSAAWTAATLVQQGLLAAQAIMNAELAAAQTLAAMIIPGVAASVPAAMGMSQSIRMMGYANAALIMAQGIGEIAGARADGGPVASGKTYLVGERGPELFTAGATGQITSHENLNRAIGGGSSNDASGWAIIVNEAPPGTEVNVDEQNKTIEIAVAQAKKEIYDDFTGRGPLRKALGQ